MLLRGMALHLLFEFNLIYGGCAMTIKLLIDRSILAGLVSQDRETRTQAERELYGVLANAQPAAPAEQFKRASILKDCQVGYSNSSKPLDLSPADGEAVEVVAWQDAENPSYTTGERRQMHGWATDGYPIRELMTVAQHQRILAQRDAKLAFKDEQLANCELHMTCLVKERNELREKLARVVEALRDADEYLSSNRFNEIGSGSILHRQMQDALAAAGVEHE